MGPPSTYSIQKNNDAWSSVPTRRVPRLAFLGKDEIQRTTLGITQKDESILNLHDNVGRQRILLIASETDAKVEVLDRDTNVVFPAQEEVLRAIPK